MKAWVTRSAAMRSWSSLPPKIVGGLTKSAAPAPKAIVYSRTEASKLGEDTCRTRDCGVTS